MATSCRLGLLVAMVLASCALARADAPLVVHEWGTFTSLQDEAGRTLSHINTDDEPVPPFVYGVGPGSGGAFLIPPTEMPPPLAQGAPVAHPQVTMRLETPVTYFHLPEGATSMSLDVAVEFRGGWLTEFFPEAAVLHDGRPFPWPKFPELTPGTVGRLEWNGVTLGGNGKGPETSEHVWLAPRKVDAANVTVNGRSERFLFYRGVGSLDAPLRVTRHADRDRLEITGDFGCEPPAGQPTRMWLLDVRPDGRCAFRAVSSTAEDPGRVIALTEDSFTDAEYQPDSSALRAEMHDVLVDRGLFDDEATAMLDTWDLSYFKSPGTRLFFTVPQGWTDRVLPLHLSAPADVTRVMVGRIELVTPRHRELLQSIAAGPVPDLKEVVTAMAKLQADPARRARYNALASGRGNPADVGVPVPRVYGRFLDLGRFRTAMVVDAYTRGSLDRAAMYDFAMEVQMPGVGIAHHRARSRAATQP